jgi:hypothetical protein
VTSPLGGDPATCSSAGGSLVRAAARLDRDAGTLRSVVRDLGAHWSGRASVRARRRVDRLAESLDDVAVVLGRIGRAMQEHASDLADALGGVRDVEVEASAVGLVVADGRVIVPWGVTGEADAVGEARREQDRARLQQSLDLALLQVDRRRRRLAAAAEASRRHLAEVSAELRR